MRADVEGDRVEALGVRSVPTLIGFHESQEVGRLVGAQTTESIDSLTAATLAGGGAVRATAAWSLVGLRGAAGLVIAGAGLVLDSLPLVLVGLGLIAWAVVGTVRR